jgi:hypothetical protein
MVRLDGDFFPEGEGSGGVLVLLTEHLALLRAIDAVEADAVSMVAVQDFEGIRRRGRRRRSRRNQWRKGRVPIGLPGAPE